MDNFSGFSKARQITKRYAKVFYLASRFLPKEKQNAAYAIYVICRDSDEAVDNMSLPQKQERLGRIRNDITAAYSGRPLKNDTLMAFSQSVKRFQIPKPYFEELIAGMQMDLDKKRYRDFQELYSYCYKVAGVIGLIMLRVFECKNPGLQKYAVDLGVAMQLTNILRDIKEDWERGRIYLPRAEMDSFGVGEETIALGKIDEDFKGLLRFQIRRARGYYASSLEGIRLIDSRRLRFVTLSMHQMYSGILDKLERPGFNVFSQRAHTSSFKKACILLKNLGKIWR